MYSIVSNEVVGWIWPLKMSSSHDLSVLTFILHCFHKVMSWIWPLRFHLHTIFCADFTICCFLKIIGWIRPLRSHQHVIFCADHMLYCCHKIVGLIWPLRCYQHTIFCTDFMHCCFYKIIGWIWPLKSPAAVHILIEIRKLLDSLISILQKCKENEMRKLQASSNRLLTHQGWESDTYRHYMDCIWPIWT